MARTRRTRLVVLVLSLLPLGLFACEEPTPTSAEVEDTMIEGGDPLLQGGGPDISIVPVFNYPPPFTQELGISKLMRRRNAIRYYVETEGLNPGHAYTLWLVVFNNPKACATDPCSDPDIFNPEVQGDLMWAGGTVVGASGKAQFAGRRRVGQSRGSVMKPLNLPGLTGPGVTNPRGADIRFVVHDHGPKDRRYMPDMVRSIDGGCTDAGVPVAGVPSPFNDYDGPRVLPGYGRRGGNECVSLRASVHLPT